jgi:hypothetical protein
MGTWCNEGVFKRTKSSDSEYAKYLVGEQVTELTYGKSSERTIGKVHGLKMCKA